MNAAALEGLRELICRAADVRRIVELVPLAGGRAAYLVETPFETFPRFVVGTADADNAEVEIGLRCGAEWSAREYFEQQFGQPFSAQARLACCEA